MVRIITDSTSDILPEEAEALGVTVVPLKVVFKDRTYRDTVDLSHEDFYRLLKTADPLPTTSQPTPADFGALFEEAKQAGDSVVCLLLAGSLSGTVQSAQIARELCGYSEVYVVDTAQAIIGIRMLVYLALRMRSEGASAEQIAAAVEEAKGRVRLYAMVDTLEYLHKGGRLSKAVTVVGTFLKMKPIVTLREGKLEVLSKARGLDGSIAALLKLMGDAPRVDPACPVLYGYTLDAGQCSQLRRVADEKYGFENTELYSVGCVIGTHVGPGAMVIGYLEAKEEQ